MDFQVRSEHTGIRNLPTFTDAMEEARKDRTIWKISWTITETAERIRLVSRDFGFTWVYESIMEDI